jgi:hypothetical protein
MSIKKAGCGEDRTALGVEDGVLTDLVTCPGDRQVGERTGLLLVWRMVY